MSSVPVIRLPGTTLHLTDLLVRCFIEERMGRLALVGGAVRDALLQQLDGDSTGQCPDLDFVLESSCIALARSLKRVLGAGRVQELHVHEKFGTAELVLDGVLIDLARARTENYPAPGLNPVVKSGSLEQDLARRDFTVNAMALVLHTDGQQLLMDPYGGQRHLARRQLAFLHERSVSDDPTRVLRGARYAARLGFQFTPAALRQVQSTLNAWPWSWRHGDPVDAVPPALGTRLRMELELLLEREPWAEALRLLQAWSALPLIDPWLQTEPMLTRRLSWAVRLGLPAMAALVATASDPIALARRLQIPVQQQRWLEELVELRSWLLEEVLTRPWSDWGALDWTRKIEAGRWSIETVALAVVDNPPCRRPLLRWWGRWRSAASPVTARELIAQGLSPGPQLGEALRQAREQVLRGMR